MRLDIWKLLQLDSEQVTEPVAWTAQLSGVGVGVDCDSAYLQAQVVPRKLACHRAL